MRNPMQNLFKKFQKHTRSHAKRLHRARKHPFALPLAVFFGLVFVSFIAFIVLNHGVKPVVSAENHIVIISHDHQKQSIPTNATTVGGLLKKLHLNLAPGDRVEPSPATQIVQDNFLVNVYRAVPITIQDGASTTRVLSAAATPRSVVAETGMTLYAEDAVATKPADNLVAQASLGKIVTIDRSTPVNLNLYGTQTLVRTHATTLAGLVAEKHITLLDGATLTPAGNTPIASNMQAFVLKKGVSIVSAQETIPMPVQTVDDNNLTLGAKAIRQVGTSGQQLVTYQVTIDPATGKEISRQVIQTVITQNAVTQIVAIGKHVDVPQDKITIMQAVGIAPGDYGYVDYIVSHEGGWGGATKSNYGGSGAYGICQALPGSKMASAGADWATNPVTQLKWCNGYAVGRFGSWAAAYNYWIAHSYW